MVREDVKRFVEDNLRVLSMMNLPEGRKKHAKWMRQQIDNKARSIENQLKDKKVTLVRQYRGHDAEIEREIRDLEETLRYLKNTKIKDAKMDYKKFIDSVVGNIARKIEDEFNEKDHPRDKGGKFTSKGGEGKGGKEEELSPDLQKKYNRSLTELAGRAMKKRLENSKGGTEKDPIPETETEKAAKEEIESASKVGSSKEESDSSKNNYSQIAEDLSMDASSADEFLTRMGYDGYDIGDEDHIKQLIKEAFKKNPKKALKIAGDYLLDLEEHPEESSVNTDTPVSIDEYREELNKQSGGDFTEDKDEENNLKARYDKALFHYNKLKELDEMSVSDPSREKWIKYYEEIGLKKPEDAFKVWWDV